MTAFAYIDDIARCVVLGGCRRGSRAYRALIDYIHAQPAYTPARLREIGIGCPDWPIVRQGEEHERRHRQVMRDGSTSR